jgi:hypothetical protein
MYVVIAILSASNAAGPTQPPAFSAAITVMAIRVWHLVPLSSTPTVTMFVSLAMRNVMAAAQVCVCNCQ